jgi:hypothetical protein
MSGVSSTTPAPGSPADLPALAREVEDFVATAGWDQSPQLFALVSTAELLHRQPHLAGTLDPGAALTPIAQEPLANDDLGAALAGIMWPSTVHGCALAQEIVVLPPSAESDLPDDSDADELRRRAAEHPARREARLVAAVLRDGSAACVLRLRGSEPGTDELVEGPELAPNLTEALRATLL